MQEEPYRTPTKTCSKCRESKPVGEFYKRPRNSDGLEGTCRACKSVYRRQRAKANPELMRRYNYRHRCGFDDETIDYVDVLIGDPCAYCGAPAENVDHIVPTVRGGDAHWTNLTATCKWCNSVKLDRSLLRALLAKTGYYLWIPAGMQVAIKGSRPLEDVA